MRGIYPSGKHGKYGHTSTVDINITQQNLTLKLVIPFEMNAKHSKRWSDQVFKIWSTSFTQAYQWKYKVYSECWEAT